MKPLGMPFAASVALMIAGRHTGRRVDKGRGRDQSNTKGLACRLLRLTGASWPDVAEAIYGHRGHASAITSAQHWNQHRGIAAEAEYEFSQLLEDATP